MPPRTTLSLNQNLWVLPLLLALAAGLTFVLPGRAASHGLFQSPLAFQSPQRGPTPGGSQSPLLSPTPPRSATPAASPTPQLSPTQTRPLPSPTAREAPARAQTATAIALSFLPPPTLSAPRPAALAAGSPGNSPAVVARAAEQPAANPVGQAGGSGLAWLLDTASLYANYAWLACGAGTVAAAGAAMAWRLSRKREP